MQQLPAPGKETLDFLKPLIPSDFGVFLNRCEIYQEFLYRVNESINLTAIPPEQFWDKHIADSVCILKFFPDLFRKHGLRICDLGCGGGLPSLILASACPDIWVTAVDSRGKKIDFVSEAAEKMELKNLRAIQARGNELGHKSDFKHRFDLVTARAVSDAKTLIRESAMLLCKDGQLVIYRTPAQTESEIPELKKMKPEPEFSTTDTIELPENAGTRMFLAITPNRKKKTS